ncbi:MAG: signal peptidase II [Bacteroidales bacterium]
MKHILRNGGIFLGIWIVVMIIFTLSHAFSNSLPPFDYLWKFSILPGLVLAAIAMSCTLLQKYIPVKKGVNWIFLILAVGLDQAIKTYLFSLEWETLSIPLIEPVFYLQPTQNTLGSYLWVLLNFEKSSHILNIILFAVIGFLFVEIWRFYTRRKRNSFWINGFIHLFLAGLFANIIDNAYWGGSLDYITIRPFYTFDLKDMYITLCEMFLLMELIDNRLLKKLFKMPKEESKALNNDFYTFIKKDITSLFKRKK